MAGPAAIGFSLAATGFKVAGSLASGAAKAQGAEFQAQQAENQAQYGQIKATQTNAYMEDNLQKTLGNISAVRSMTGTTSDSPTGAAVTNYSEFLGDRDRTQAVANIENQVTADQQGAAFYTHSAKNAIMGGFLGAADNLASGLSGAFTSMGGMGGGSGASTSQALASTAPNAPGVLGMQY